MEIKNDPLQEEEPGQYVRCRTCGDFFRKEEGVKDYFCSNVCATKYTRCLNCGRFFTRLYKNDPPYCSPECAVAYPKIIKSAEIDEVDGEFV